MLERWQSLFPIWLSVLLFASFGLGLLSNGFEYSSIWYLLIGCILLWYGGYRLRGTAEETGEKLTDGVQIYFKATIGLSLVLYTVFVLFRAVSVLY
jgi:hypothetical protein